MRFDIRNNGIDYEVMVEVSIHDDGGVTMHLEVDDVLNGREYSLEKDINGGSFDVYQEMVDILEDLSMLVI